MNPDEAMTALTWAWDQDGATFRDRVLADLAKLGQPVHVPTALAVAHQLVTYGLAVLADAAEADDEVALGFALATHCLSFAGIVATGLGAHETADVVRAAVRELYTP